MVDSKHQWKAWLYLLPAIVLLLVFTVWPIINTVRLSFLEGYNALGVLVGTQYNIGLGNFKEVLAGESSDFIVGLKNTLVLTVLTVPLSTVLGLLIAVALNSIKPLQKFFQTIFFLPYVTNSIAIGMVFTTMFNIIGLRAGGTAADSWGVVNNVIMFFGGQPIDWINYTSTWGHNIAVMVVYIVWNALPFKILILLGGLQSINKQYYEAARVDGTPRWRVLTRITVPMLSPMLAYVVITGFIGGFKEYSSIVGVFGDGMGPAGKDGTLNTMVGYIYESLPEMNYGVASAAALVLFGIILVVTLFNSWVSKKSVHY